MLKLKGIFSDAHLHVCFPGAFLITLLPILGNSDDFRVLKSAASRGCLEKGAGITRFELAVAGGAKAVVTHNVKDFRRSELRFPDIGIMTPAKWLKEGS